MLYSFSTNPAVAILSGTCIYIRYLQKENWNQLFLTSVPWDDTITQLLASSCHLFKGEISRDKQVKWFDCVLFLEKYRKTSHMIWRCPIHWEISYTRVRWFECVLILEKYRKTSLMIWRYPLPWKLAGGTDMQVPCIIRVLVVLLDG